MGSQDFPRADRELASIRRTCGARQDMSATHSLLPEQQLVKATLIPKDIQFINWLTLLR
jgi:hypothetical protein